MESGCTILETAHPGAAAYAGGESARHGEPGALVVGGAHGSLGVVRSLGRRGIPVWFLSHDHPIARFSRYARSSFTWRGPGQAGAVEELLAFGRRHNLNGWVLFPGGDAEANCISQNHDRLSEVFRLTTPPWETVRWAADKRLTYECAARVGVSYPESYYPVDRDAAAHLPCRFPVVMKPASREKSNPFTRAKAWRVDDRESLIRRYDEAAGYGEDAIIVQEMILGNGSAQFSYAAVCDRGVPVASLVARRARQYPIDFGFTSTLVTSIEQSEIEDIACRFLRAIAYTGLVELEFKYDARDSCFKILDFNARTWAWQSLGRLAGVDFAHVMWRMSLGEHVERIRGRAGVSWVHFSRDLVAAWQEMRAGSLSFSDYLRSLRTPLEFAAFAKDDPLPGIVDLPLMAKRLLQRFSSASHF
jgi:predicted ATP-grasp superfamily ATP-dependent carboligase